MSLQTLRPIIKLIKKIHGSPRSDIVLPLSAWRGENGICEKRFEELFGTR